MFIQFFLLLLVAGASFSTRSAPNSTWWPCTSLTAEHDFQLNQILGQWYLVETISPLPGRSSSCAGVKFVHGGESSWNNLTMIGQEVSPLGDITYENHTVIIGDTVNHKGFWEQSDIGAVVLVADVGVNNDILALTTCHLFLQYDWTGVFSRNRTVNSDVLSQTNERLTTAGLQNVDSATVLSSTNCQSIP